MELISKKSILIIAPSLIAESLSLKLTSLNQNLDIYFNNGKGDKTPDLVIWNVLNFQTEDLIRLELLKLMSKFWSSDVNLSDKDSAIKLGAIINIDFFEINSKTRFLIS